jgi:hypothetical protein
MYRHMLALVALLALTSMSQAGADSFFPEKVHDFGATPHGPTLVHYFRLTNSGKETLTIGGVRVSCGCVTASAPVREVKPGESSYICAQMDTRRFVGSRTVTVYVSFSKPQMEEVSLQVTANSLDELTMYPEIMAFGGIAKGATAKSTVQLTMIGDPKWDVTTAKADSNYVKPEIKVLKRNGAEVTFEVSATLRNDLPVGKWYTDVWLTTNSPIASKVRVPLTVEVSPVTVNPVALMLGDIKVGDNVEEKVVVSAEKPFKIKSVLGTDALVSVTGMEGDPKAMYILKFSVKPLQAGAISREVKVQTDGDDSTTFTIPVRATAKRD